jgi:uncharacterized membrane protein YccC
MNWDIVRLRNDLQNVAQELKEVKKLFREPGQPQVNWSLGQRLSRLKKRATMLCSIRAHRRRRIHLSRLFKCLDEQQEFIQTEAVKYELQITAE